MTDDPAARAKAAMAEITRRTEELAPTPSLTVEALQGREAAPQALFAEAARTAVQTPPDQRERDLTEIISQLETTAQAKDSPERTEFREAQAALADQITREPDPERRAELRTEREAQGHLYAADLADRVGAGVASIGQLDTAKDMHELAEAHREIAAALRNPTDPEKRRAERLEEPEGPEGPDDGPHRPPGGGGANAEQFAKDAAAVGKEVLGRSAEVVMTTEGPQPQRPEATLTRGVSVGIGPGGPVLVEINQDRPDVGTERGRNPDGSLSLAAFARASTEARTQQAEEAALRPIEAAAVREADPAARAKATMAEVRREAEQGGHEREGVEQSPSRASGQGAQRSAGRYASLG